MSVITTHKPEELVPVTAGVTIVIGTFVKAPDKSFLRSGGFGSVIAITEEGITVLWSVEPREPFLNIPKPRRIFPSTIARQFVSIQPMSLPAGNVFYMDFTHASGSLSSSITPEAQVQPIGGTPISQDTGKVLSCIIASSSSLGSHGHIRRSI